MLSALFALGSAPSQPGQQSTAPWWTNLVPLLLMIFVFFFIFIRPQQKKARQHSELMKTLKPGDKILTNGGVIGVVVSVKEKTVSIRSSDSKFEIVKSAVAEVTERAGESSSS